MSDFVNPRVQAMNLVRYIGDQVSESGEPIWNLSGSGSVIGAPSEQLFCQLVEELYEEGLIRMSNPVKTLGGTTFLNVALSQEGWKRYEEDKRAIFDESHGFIAMQFGNPDLDAFVRDVLKPAVERDVGFKVVDMRDVGRAGIIDNIMRDQIRDARFVIVDLTHDNHGAYWEGGYAEGLGKPVIYICEKKKFEQNRTHFDTNHCTTVLWSRDDDDAFQQELTATLRRSLESSA